MKDKELPLILGGDGRADTPGHSAKYGSYAMLDLNLMMVVDFQLVQVESFILYTMIYIVIENDKIHYFRILAYYNVHSKIQ